MEDTALNTPDHLGKEKGEDSNEAVWFLQDSSCKGMKSIAKEERTNEQRSNLTKTKYDEVKPVEKNNDTVEILQGLHDEIISKDIRTLKSKEEAHIQLCQRKTSVPSQRKSSQGQNIKAAVTPEKKQEKKQTVLSMEDYIKKSPVIQVGNLLGLRQCHLCTVMFAEKEQLIIHMKTVHHLDEKPFKCMQCESSFRKSVGLKQHITRQHSQNQPLKSGLLNTWSNNNDRPYLCQICDKAFKRRHHLQEHSFIHSANKPFKCDACGKTFNQKISLTKHLPCRAKTRGR